MPVNKYYMFFHFIHAEVYASISPCGTRRSSPLRASCLYRSLALRRPRNDDTILMIYFDLFLDNMLQFLYTVVLYYRNLIHGSRGFVMSLV